MSNWRNSEDHDAILDILYYRPSSGTKTVIGHYTMLSIGTITRCLEHLIDDGDVEEAECVFPSQIHGTQKHPGFRLTDACRNVMTREFEETAARLAIKAGEKEIEV